VQRGHAVRKFGHAAGREPHVGDHRRDRVVAPVVGEPSGPKCQSSIPAATGINSTVVTPRRTRCASAAGWASRAGSAQCFRNRRVESRESRTWSSYTMARDSGTRGHVARASANSGSTRAFGT
jgi:hypothetical protein